MSKKKKKKLLISSTETEPPVLSDEQPQAETEPPGIEEQQPLVESDSSESESEIIEEPEQQQPERVPGMFQAVGVVEGTVKFSDDGTTTTITIEDKEYSLFYAPRLKKAIDALKKEVERTGTQQKLVVYPRILHFPDKTKPHQLSFQLVGFAGKLENESCPSHELETGEFKLSGLWQFIPVSRIPCISVFKNYSTQRKEYIKKQDDPSKKARYMKASHIPLKWIDALVPPFRYNPTLEKHQQAKTYFVSLKASFNPGGNIFEFESLTAPPQEKAPRFLRVSKTDKAEAERLKMKARKAAQPKSQGKKTTKPQDKNVTKSESKPMPKPVIKPKVTSTGD
ncbi:MAG: hypothetical protein H0X31_00615 [Nostocaceae cyanobacterium]|nr:hypothetical protein [Nostocaceae cyanobacterium]